MVDILSDHDMPRSKASVLLVSDDVESAHIWAYSLEQTGLEVCHAGFTEKTLQVWSGESPDLMILEDHNARTDVFEFCKRLREQAAIPILILSATNQEAYQLAAYQAGADDCVLPPVSPRLFLAKVKAWLRRSQVLPSAALDFIKVGDFHLDAGRRLLTTPDGKLLKLTNLETRLLYLLMNHPAWIMETGYLVNRVWGHFGDGDSILLKNLVYRVRQKIEPNPSQPCYLLTESNLGYRFRPEGEFTIPAGGSTNGKREGSDIRRVANHQTLPPTLDSNESATKRKTRNTGQLHPRFPRHND